VGDTVRDGVQAPADNFKPSWIVLGVALGIVIQFLPRPVDLSPHAWLVVSMVVVMVTWWVTEAIPIPVTSLVPMVFLPVAGISTIAEAAMPYADRTIMLLLGGFIIAKSVERWNLHSRIALAIVSRVGSSPHALVGGFMIASAALSMWISNTATTLMLAPIALSVGAALTVSQSRGAPLTVALLLGVAYSASIGGLGTLIGSPTNIIVVSNLETLLDTTITFTQWMMLGVPVVLLMIPGAWFVLTRFCGDLNRDLDPQKAGREVVGVEIQALGKLTTPELRVAIVFGVVAFFWVSRDALLADLTFGDVKPFAGLTDHVIAIAGAIALFLIPSGSTVKKGTALLDWQTAEQIPWGALLLFGGGISMATAVSNTGLADWLGESMMGVTALPPLAIVLVITTFVIFATELTSNVATATTVMPIVAALATASGADPVLLAAPVAMAASCAFMLPLATTPNAIVYATGHVSIRRMAKAGMLINLFGIGVISLACFVLTPLIFT
jgi:solute carrier family 13 (sodium-dependent dicarboxylate transporter), member 2/3/5